MCRRKPMHTLRLFLLEELTVREYFIFLRPTTR
jgi:hypothetical protein